MAAAYLLVKYTESSRLLSNRRGLCLDFAVRSQISEEWPSEYGHVPPSIFSAKSSKSAGSVSLEKSHERCGDGRQREASERRSDGDDDTMRSEVVEVSAPARPPCSVQQSVSRTGQSNRRTPLSP